MAAFLILVPLALAVQPSGATHGVIENNDDFADAYDLTPSALPYDKWVEAEYATMEAGEPDNCGASTFSLWYKFVPTTRVGITMEVRSDGYREFITNLYRGTSLDNLEFMECEVDVYGAAIINIAAEPGTTYYYQIAGRDDRDGDHVHVEFFTEALEPNDDFADALVVGEDGVYELDFDYLTREEGEPEPCGILDKTAWYRYDAVADGTLVVARDWFNEATIAAYTGSSVDALTTIDCQQDGFVDAYLEFPVAAGTSYYVQFGADEDEIFWGDIRILYAPPAPNDDFANATLVTAPFSDELRIEGTATEAGEPTACLDDHTVWYKYTAPADQTLLVTDVGTSFELATAAYEGTSLDSLTRINCEEHLAALHPTNAFQVSAGQTYHVQVGEHTGNAGLLSLAFEEVPTPANDNFADATPLAGNTNTIVSIVGATNEADEPYPCDLSSSYYRGDGSLWYTYTPTTDDTLRVATHALNDGTDVTVYTGSSLSDLEKVQGSCSRWSAGHAQFTPEIGTTYFIQIDAKPAREDVRLEVGQFPRPANDDRHAGQLISIPTTLTVDTRGATTDDTDLNHCNARPSSVWYDVDVPATTWVALQATSTYYEPDVALLTGDVDNIQSSLCASNGNVRYALLKDSEEYHMMVGSGARMSGDVSLSLTAMAGPVNDDFADALSITEGQPFSGNLSFATPEVGEPGCDTQNRENTMWFEYTAATTGTAVLTHLGGSGALHAVYQGTSLSDLTNIACGTQFHVEAGERFWIQSARQVLWPQDIEQTTLRLDVVAPPVNDLFADALEITPTELITIPVDSIERATQDRGHDGCAEDRSIWYKFDAADAFWLKLQAADIFGYQVGLYRGSTLADLELLDCSDVTTELIFAGLIEGGHTYYLAIEQWAGTIDHDLELTVERMVRPGNDMFRHAKELVSFPARETISTQGATPENGELQPCLRTGIRSVWYTFTAEAPGVVTIDTTGSSFDTQVALYHAADAPFVWNGLAKMGCADLPDGGEQLAGAVVPGETYYIQVAGTSGRWGNLVLDVDVSP